MVGPQVGFQRKHCDDEVWDQAIALDDFIQFEPESISSESAFKSLVIINNGIINNLNNLVMG